MKLLSRLLILGMVLAACGGKKEKTVETIPPVRQGQKLGPVDIKFVDVEPSLSADGQKIVFVSGREGVARIFFRDLSQGGELKRLSQGDGAESHPSMSADGSMAAFFRSEAGSLKLWAQSTADANKKIEIPATEGSTLLGRASSFSPSGSLLLFFERDGSGVIKQKITKITDSGTELTLSAPATFSFGDGEMGWARWWRLGSGFAVVAPQVDGAVKFQRVNFSSESLSDAQLVSWGDGKLERLSSSVFAPFGDYLGFVQKLSAREKEIEPYGDQTAEEKGKVPVQNRLRLLTASGAISDIETTQTEVLDAEGTSDGKYLVTLGYEYIGCKFRQVYGSTLVVHDLVAKTQQRLFLAQDESKNWRLVTDACASFSETTPKENKILDLYTLSFSLAPNATNGNLRIALETFFSGDPEIRVVDLSGAVGSLSTVVSEVSKNEIQK